MEKMRFWPYIVWVLTADSISLYSSAVLTLTTLKIVEVHFNLNDFFILFKNSMSLSHSKTLFSIYNCGNEIFNISWTI